MDLEILLQATKEQMPISRWEHTLRVKDTALQLADRLGMNPHPVTVASILHDYCKFWPDTVLAERIRQSDLPKDLLQYNKELWHGPVAAIVARDQFGITDPDVLHAIQYHTSGREGMSQLEKVIWLADYIEPARQFPGLDEVRLLAETNLDQALLKALENTIQFLIQRKQKVYPPTLLARNWLLDQVAQMQTESREEFF
ncbi:putative HD superfamily hydrolase involved in NAD metabolism [Laceyella sacchari]|jgi:predicted HD superfamily hydrolase involved in NAD metabolism|uniref:bis(5'-nucleosyl)-tetraphosphatase (symmetrical) YqeK n=1 Tax=Laceyella sacchari TaxID=37482 RepID=UPI001047691F|nr:bis(5'-nucleosyl)-tetraphosphatase (symmetrical) YqeK [Laceyella sacchari]TCW37738.1 putative HD superfamily hydrolase involved in NAD metabolism [Laceyella sacchari]